MTEPRNIVFRLLFLRLRISILRQDRSQVLRFLFHCYICSQGSGLLGHNTQDKADQLVSVQMRNLRVSKHGFDFPLLFGSKSLFSYDFLSLNSIVTLTSNCLSSVIFESEYVLEVAFMPMSPFLTEVNVISVVFSSQSSYFITYGILGNTGIEQKGNLE
jgi:hypothetical protein